MTVCNYYDCGWCYAPDNVSTSAQPSGACVVPSNCLYLKSQMTINLDDYVDKEVIVTYRNGNKEVGLLSYKKDDIYCQYRYKFGLRWYTWDGKFVIDQQNSYDIVSIVTVEENDKNFENAKQTVETMTEKEQIQSKIVSLQKQLAYIEEAEKQQPKTLLDAIRNLGYSTDCCYEIIDAVENFYETVDDDPSPQTPEEMEQSLKESFKKAQQTEKWKQIQKLIDEEDNDRIFKNSLEAIREWGEKNKPQTLYQLIEEWWSDIFSVNSMDDMETCIDDLVERISKKFIPPSSDSNTYDWERCLKMMRGKLR